MNERAGMGYVRYRTDVELAPMHDCAKAEFTVIDINAEKQMYRKH
jgi:hypothetical protein